MTLGRKEEAIACYDHVLQIDPRDAGVWYNKGVALSALGRNEEAIVCCDGALEIDPRNLRAWNKKGNALSDLGRYQEAIVCYDRALEVDAHNLRLDVVQQRQCAVGSGAQGRGYSVL